MSFFTLNRRSIYFVIVYLGAVLYSGCTPSGVQAQVPESIPRGCVSPDSLSVQLLLEVPEPHGTVGEEIRFQPYFVYNGNQPLTIVHSSIAFRIIIMQGDTRVYPSGILMFTSDGVEKKLMPGEKYFYGRGHPQPPYGFRIALKQAGTYDATAIFRFSLARSNFEHLGKLEARHRSWIRYCLSSEKVAIEVEAD